MYGHHGNDFLEKIASEHSKCVGPALYPHVHVFESQSLIADRSAYQCPSLDSKLQCKHIDDNYL